ncbi:MAG: hypothetical protein VX223_00255 [Myxococcota bacterium]|nr:hypothetical protein [Myxococcota bacterium]
MPMIVMALPILPGKKETWLEMINQINSEPMRSEFFGSREAVGVHERTYIQESPHGDFAIITMEGDDPVAAFATIMANSPPEFAAFAKDVHGLDMSEPPSLPRLVVDTKA